MRRMLALPLAVACLVACGGPSETDEAARRTFLRGSEAFQRSVSLEQAARTGDLEAYKAAVMQAETALAFWQRAAASRPDWPEAGRNVERALLRVERLREKRGGKRKDGEKDPGTQPPDRPPRPDRPKPPGPGDDAPLPAPEDSAVDIEDLPEARVLGLFDVLQARERQKLVLRRAQRRIRTAAVERDW